MIESWIKPYVDSGFYSRKRQFLDPYMFGSRSLIGWYEELYEIDI